MTTDNLDRAVDHGIITAEQRDAIRALRDEPAHAGPGREIREGLNAITITYGIGAGIVLFGFGWFLVDRWRALGAGGVLVVAVLYATLFTLVAVWLDRHRYPIASAVSLSLAVGMAPIIGWAALELAGMWPAEQRWCGSGAPFIWQCAGKWVVLDLIVVLSALIAMRWRPHPMLTLPIAVALLFLLAHVVESASAFGLQRFGSAWVMVIGASLLSWLAYEVDRRFEARGDYAFTLWIAAAGAAFVSITALWDYDRNLRHLLPFLAIAALGIAILLRRTALVVLGAMFGIAYMAHLVDLFREWVALPVLLATMGMVIILLAVWVQRTYPRWARRADAARSGPKRLPGGAFPLLAPGLLGLIMILGPARARDHEVRVERMHQRRVWEARSRRERALTYRNDSLRAARGDTAAARRLERMRESGSPRNPPRRGP